MSMIRVKCACSTNVLDCFTPVCYIFRAREKSDETERMLGVTPHIDIIYSFHVLRLRGKTDIILSCKSSSKSFIE